MSSELSVTVASKNASHLWTFTITSAVRITLLLFRPLGTVVTSGFMLYCSCFFFQFAALYLRVASANCCETLEHIGCGGNLNGRLVASCVRDIHTKTVKIWSSFFKLQSIMSEILFGDTVYNCCPV